MAGIFGIVSEEDCIRDVLSGTFYLQNRAEEYCGIAWKNGDDKLRNSTHRGLVKNNYTQEKLSFMKGNFAIGTVSGSREPVSELSNKGGMSLCYDGNIANYEELKNSLLKNGASFSGYHTLEEIYDSILISKIISKAPNFGKGIESLVEQMRGDFALVALTPEGIYASRGWGRKPLILGKRDGSYAVSSESVSFINPGFEIVRDVNPGETVFIDNSGIHHVQQLDLSPIKLGTFEWVYTAHPASVVDGQSVELARNAIGSALARRYPVDADIVSPVPNSGRCHADGYASESGIMHREVFKKFDYCGRSFTPNTLEDQQAVADEKLIPVRELIEGKRIIFVDDSIVKGNQTRKQSQRLRELGAKEVHARIACPPLMSACIYGKSIKNDEDCIAKRMSLEEIRITRRLDSLEYATIEDLEGAIGKSRDMLCVDCWGL